MSTNEHSAVEHGAPLFAAERQQAMVELILRDGRASVAELATRFAVTTETVRRDLALLERGDLVRRVHGGAVPTGSATVGEADLPARDGAHASAKDRIAARAAELVPASGSVILDAGSTTARLAARLDPAPNLLLITHAVPIAALLAARGAQLQLLPGRVRPTTQAAVGCQTVAALAGLRADVGFIGANGLSLGHGLSTPDPDEAATKAAIVASCHRVVALVDSSKFGVERTLRFAELHQLDTLVTDAGIDVDLRSALVDRGIEVLIG